MNASHIGSLVVVLVNELFNFYLLLVGEAKSLDVAFKTWQVARIHHVFVQLRIRRLVQYLQLQEGHVC